MSDNYNSIVNKIDDFIDKFYKDKVIRGSIYFFGFFSALALIIMAGEYFLYFNALTKTILFYGFWVFSILSFSNLVLLPFLKMRRFLKHLTHDEAALIIGDSFPSVKDKLFNTLQLKKYSNFDNSLVEASIDQKAFEMKPITFSSIIDFKANIKYFKFLGFSLLLFIIVPIIFPDFIGGSVQRLWNYNTSYTAPSPYSYYFEKPLKAIEGEDFVLNIHSENSRILPKDLYVKFGGNLYKAVQISNNTFQYIFSNLRNDLDFNLVSGSFETNPFKLQVLNKPGISNLVASLSFPAYLRLEDKKINSLTDLEVPAGTKVTWTLSTIFSDEVDFRLNGKLNSLPKIDNRFSFQSIIQESSPYSIHVKNLNGLRDSLNYFINVIPDAYPSIEVSSKLDSISLNQLNFSGIIHDDHGFTRLNFLYKWENDKQYKSFSVNINKTLSEQGFLYQIPFSKFADAGKKVEYFFEVWDNDGNKGPKSSKSIVSIYDLGKDGNVEELLKKSNESIKNDLADAIKESKKLQKDISQFSKSIREKKSLSWEDKKKAESLMERQKQLESQIKDVQKQSDLNKFQQDNNLANSDEIKEKQQQLNELLQNVNSEEFKKLMEELNQMMDLVDKQKLQEKLDEFKLNSKDVEKQLDRSLELFKQLEFESKFENSIKKMEELAKKEEELSKQSQNEKASDKTLDEQKKLTEEFKELSKGLKELEDKDKKLETPNGFRNPEKQEEKIQEEMDNSEKNLQDKKSKKGSQNQKNASEEMKELSLQLQQMKEGMESKESDANEDAIRSLLENLLKLSFNQEELMDDLKKVSMNDPKFPLINQQQKKIKDQAQSLEDSLFKLSKKVVQIQSFVNKESALINHNIEKATAALEDRNISEAGNRQQLAMTSINNLALLLNESLQQMMQANSKPGSQSCSKPGGKKPNKGSGMSSIKKMQEDLNKKMEEYKKGQKPGQQMGQGMGNKEIAKMAAQQQAIRNALQKINQENGDKGNNGRQMNELLNKMEQTERELVNKKVNPETMKRQQDILTRLLEAEKSERERDMDNKRESNSAKTDFNRNPFAFEEYKRLKKKEQEMLEKLPPALNSFYKQKNIQYFNNLGK